MARTAADARMIWSMSYDKGLNFTWKLRKATSLVAVGHAPETDLCLTSAADIIDFLLI